MATKQNLSLTFFQKSRIAEFTVVLEMKQS